jgi:hypothetical protein
METGTKPRARRTGSVQTAEKICSARKHGVKNGLHLPHASLPADFVPRMPQMRIRAGGPRR